MQPLEPDDPPALGAYRLLRRLGAGGMGRVYLARSGSGRTVAVKAVHPHFAVDEEFRRRFRREVESARRVGEGWTAPVLDADADAPVPWVATGYVAGPSLTQAVEEYGPLPETTVRAVGAGLAEALRHVHGLGLVHRDVKPSNVLVTVDGPRLIDFGIARATDGTASLTSSGVSIGSPGYMSPEQVLAKGTTAASDVFSLGAVLAYAATGKAPFPGDSSAALLYKVVHEEPELDGLEGELRELVTRCLAKDPAGRPTPEELASALAGTAGGASGLVRSGWLPAPLVEQVGRRAVELLDLEPEPDRGHSGPVPFTQSSQGPAPASSAVPASSASAGFGPPDPSYGQGAAPASAAPEPATKPPEEPPPPEKRRRKVSCTVVVSFACFAVAAVLSSYFLLPLGDGGGAKDQGAEPPRASPPSDGGGQGMKDFLGTWQGPVTFKSGTPGGTMTITIKDGKPGEKVATGGTKIAGVGCKGYWKLDSVRGKKLTMNSVAEEDSPFCAGNSKGDTFTLRGDGSLRFVAAVGNGPSGTLRKIE
ncbi:serine/threonine-protein kinase [Streptomyces sp. NPDC048172]|uniref:serine/threonine-protein kinase n=1 Tax=Streptomyces sp. NPDC048172 TaxID=3365505 RepID=UPI0037120960